MAPKTRDPEEIMQALPIALRRLRRRAGQASIRAAARTIQRQTGSLVNAAMVSQWERHGGHRPTVESLTSFLAGLGFGFDDLQREIDAVLAGAESPEAEAAGR